MGVAVTSLVLNKGHLSGIPAENYINLLMIRKAYYQFQAEYLPFIKVRQNPLLGKPIPLLQLHPNLKLKHSAK